VSKATFILYNRAVSLQCLVALSNESCVQRVVVHSDNATEERVATECVQIIEYVICGDYFMHRQFHKLAI
jgi:hypothetical protein